MKNKTSVIVALLFLIFAIGNYFRINQDNNIRAVEFLSILAMGVFLGILIVLIVKSFRSNKPKE